jgi:Type IV secretion system pilin
MRTKKLIFIALLFFFIAGPVLAQEINYPKLPGAQAPQDFLKTAAKEDVPGLWVKYAINLTTWAAGIIALLVLIWGGIKFLTSTGSPDKITEARKQISSAFLGLMIILTAYFVLKIINPYFTNFTLPSLENFSAANTLNPPKKTEGSSIDVYVPFGRIIENIFQTYVSNPGEVEKKDDGSVVPETLTRIQRITNVLDASEQLLPPIMQKTDKLRDLSKKCDCFENCRPDPRCTSCATCPSLPPLCTGDPCKDTRSDIVRTENELMPFLFGSSGGLDAFSNLIGNVQLLGGVDELEHKIDSGDTAGTEDTTGAISVIGGMDEFKSMVDSVGGLDNLENIVKGVDEAGGIEPLTATMNVVQAMGGMDQLTTVVENFGGIDNLENVLKVADSAGTTEDFGSTINSISKIGGLDGLNDIIDKAGSLDDFKSAANIVIEIGGIDELNGIIDKAGNANSFADILNLVKTVGSIDTFGDSVNNVLNTIGIDQLDALATKAGSINDLADVVNFMKSTGGNIEEIKNMFDIVDKLGGVDGITNMINKAGRIEDLQDLANATKSLGGIDQLKSFINQVNAAAGDEQKIEVLAAKVGGVQQLSDLLAILGKIGGIDEFTNIVNSAGGINDLADVVDFMRKMGGNVEEIKNMFDIVDKLGGVDGITNMINKAGSINNLSDAVNFAKQAGGTTELKNILQNLDSLGGLTELRSIINNIENLGGNLNDLSKAVKAIQNMGGIQNFTDVVNNIGGISQLQNTLNLVSTAGGFEQFSTMINQINSAGGVTELQNIINSAGGAAQLRSVLTTATATGGINQLSTIIDGVNTLGGPTEFGTILDALGSTALGGEQGVDGVYQHDAYGLPYTINTNLTKEISKLEDEVRLLQNWFDRLGRAQEFIQSCDWTALSNRNTFLQKKDEFEAKGWTIQDEAFYDDLGVILDVPENPTTLTQRWFPKPGTKLKEMADESTLYCAVGGTYARQPSDFKLGLTPPDPFSGIGDQELEKYLENEPLYTSQMACDVTIPFGEILDKANRMARSLLNNLELILDREKKIVDASGRLPELISQCSSRLCFPVCICVPIVHVCVEFGCFGPACPKGDIGDTARDIDTYVAEIQQAATNVRQIFSQAPDLLQGMQDSLRNHMTVCTSEKEVGNDVEFYTCDLATGATNEIGKIIRQCDPGTNNQWQDTLYGGCLNNCFLSKISKTPTGTPTTFFDGTDYRKCVSDCMASVCIYNYNHEFNYYCCHYKK